MRAAVCIVVAVHLLGGGAAEAAKGFLGPDALPITRKVTPVPLPMSGKQLQRRLKPILAGHLEGFNYDSLIFINRYLSHFTSRQAKKKGVSAADAYWSYRPQGESEVRGKNRGSHCFGLAADLAAKLARQKITAVIAPSVQWVTAEGLSHPEKPRYDHAAALIPFQNPGDPHDRGVVLLDPGLNFATPVVLRPNRSTRVRQRGLELSCTLDESTGAIHVSHPERFHAFYHLRQWRNPDPRLARLILTKNSRPEIVARDRAGAVVAGLRLDLRGRRVLVNVEGEKVQVPFEDREGIHKAISAVLARRLGQGVQTLRQRVDQVLDHEGTLQELRNITR